MKLFLLRLVACLFVVSSSSHAALYDRGNGLIYDDVLDITWMQDANYAQTSGYAAANAVINESYGSFSIFPGGQMGWDAAKTWVEQLNYGGYDDWRLPFADEPIELYNITTSDLGHMFYNNLSNLGYRDTNGNIRPSGYGLTNRSFTDGDTGASLTFLNLQSYSYHFAQNNVFISNERWAFENSLGLHISSSKSSASLSWAVADGDIVTLGLTSVPIPAAAWLFGSALAGLLVARSKTKK